MPGREGLRLSPPVGLRVNRQSTVPVHVQLKTQIRHLIMTGLLKPGSQVPTVRQLAGFLQINPNTAAKALAELQEGGFLESRPGRGTFVADRPASAEGKQARGLERLVDETLERVRRLGYPVEEFLATAAARTPAVGPKKARRIRALVVECNWPEVSRFRDELEAELPLTVDCMLAEELTERARDVPSFARQYGVVITTFFHINDVKRALADESVAVVALPVESSIATLRRLSELPPGTAVGLVCNTPKGSQNLLRSVESTGLSHLKPILASADDPWSLSRMLEATSAIVVCSEQAALKLRGTLPPAVEVIIDSKTLDHAGLDLLRDLVAQLDESPRPAAR